MEDDIKRREMNEASADLRSPSDSTLDRRDVMKLGAAAVMSAALAAPVASAPPVPAQLLPVPSGPLPAPYSMRKPGEIAPFTGPGYKYDANRLGNNGPMDDTTRKIVKFVAEFNESKMSPAAVHRFNQTMVDSLAAIVSGFEEEPVRIAAKVAQQASPRELKCTVLGYGVETTPELATYANGCLIRMTDFNDCMPPGGNHTSTLIPAALALGEALHSTGSQVMAAIAIGYELADTPTGGESVQAAMVAGKLLGFDEDRLANALTIALTPHVALNKGVGAMSMWKGTRSAEAAKCGVWGAILARAGMTGPPQPFEGRGGLWSTQRSSPTGMGPNFTLPAQADSLAIQRNWFKLRPAEASSQGLLIMMPEIRAYAKPDEIASIHWDTSSANWEEICDSPKWDPRNRETADHSLPYIIARAMLDGDIYLDSFDEAKYMDPAARALMDKTTIAPVEGWGYGNGMGRLTIVKKSGESKYFDTYKGVRYLLGPDYPQLSAQGIIDKYNHACAFKKVNNAQRDQAYKLWSNLSAVKDFSDAMKSMAKFGQPKPL